MSLIYSRWQINVFCCTFSDGKRVAKEFGCKYIEVSVLLNHHVDKLLVGIIRQIRLQAANRRTNQRSTRIISDLCLSDSCSVPRAARGLFTRVFKSPPWAVDSCDNFMIP